MAVTREEREPKFRLARPFIPVLQPASRCYMRCWTFRLELAIRWRHSAAEFLHLSPRAEDKNGMGKFGSLSSLAVMDKKKYPAHGLARLANPQFHFCHRPLRRNGVISYRNDAISPQDRQRAGELHAWNPPRARWHSWSKSRAVCADPANPWSSPTSLDPAHHIPKFWQDRRTSNLHPLGRHLLDPDVAP